MYDRGRMKTVLVSGSAPVPAPLRELVERGSTSFREQHAAELTDTAIIDADRIVFWTAADDAGIRKLAERYGRAEAAERREMVMFVTTDQGATPALPPDDVFFWPRDEDRLKMAFLTGA